MKKKSNLRKLIDKKTKYQQKYNNFSQISWIQKIKLRSKMKETYKLIDSMTSSTVITKSSSRFNRFILRILVKIFKIEISKNNDKNSNREKVRNGLYSLAKNIAYNKFILEKKAKKDRNTELFNDLNTVITKHYGKSEKDLTKLLLELEKENNNLNSRINRLTQQKEYIGKQDSAFRVESKLMSSDDVTDEWVKRLKKSAVNNIKPVDLFYKQPDDITYMKHD